MYVRMYFSMCGTYKIKSGCAIINILLLFTTCGKTEPISCRCQYCWTRLNESCDPQIIAVLRRRRENSC